MRILMWEHFAPGGAIRVGGHHFADRFLRSGARVAWCVGPLSPINFVKTNAETKARMKLWRRGGELLEEGKLFAYAPMTLIPYRPYPLLDSGFVHKMSLRATVPRLRGVLSQAGFDRVDVLWMSPGSPLLALMDEVAHDISVYRMCDDTPHFSDTPRSFRAVEERVCRSVDLVIATASRLAERARRSGARRVLHLPNACDPEPFQESAAAEPEELRSLPRPRAIYAGGIDSWFDTDLLAQVARRMPDWQFVIIGPARVDLTSLEIAGNVVLLGPRRYDDLPSFLGAADVGIVPFRLTPMTHAIHPIKIYEYMAAGLPVVATPMEETASMGAPLTLAGDAAAFETALRNARSEDPRARGERIAFALRNTWEQRFAEARSALAGLLGSRSCSAAEGTR